MELEFDIVMQEPEVPCLAILAQALFQLLMLGLGDRPVALRAEESE